MKYKFVWIAGIIGITGCAPTHTQAEFDLIRLSTNVTGLQSTIIELKGDIQRLQVKPSQYQLITLGARSWRFDTTTGSICLLLASKADIASTDLDKSWCTLNQR
jgi:hypothetical protein